MSTFKQLVEKYSESALLISLPQAVGILAALVTLPIVLFSIAPDDYGALQFILAIQVWLTAFTAGNITTGSKRALANNKDGTFLYAFFQRCKFFLPASLLGFFIAAYFYWYSGEPLLGVLMAVLSAYTLFGYLPQVSYPEYQIAKKDFHSFFLWQLALSVFVPIGSTLAAFLTQSILFYAFVQFALISVISIMGFFTTIFKHGLWSAYREQNIDRECYSYGLRLIPSEILLTTSNQVSNFIIGPFFGFVNLAVFSVATRMEVAFRGFLRISYNLLYTDFAKEDFESVKKNLRNKMKMLFGYSFLASLFCLIVGSAYILLFLPEVYHGAFWYLSIIALGFPAFIIQSVLRTALDANLRHKEINTLIISSSLIRIGAICVLGYFFQVVGVVIATALLSWFELFITYQLTLNRRYPESK